MAFKLLYIQRIINLTTIFKPMKRAEIEEQIKQAIDQSFKSYKIELDYEECIPRLTDLFIQLSEERCKEQKEICRRAYINCEEGAEHEVPAILNAPLPEIL